MVKSLHRFRNAVASVFEKAAFALLAGGQDRAQGAPLVGPIVAITVGAIVIAFVGVVGLDQLADTTISPNASTGAESIFGILDLIVALAFLLLLIAAALRV